MFDLMPPEEQKKLWKRAKAQNDNPADAELDYMTSVIFRITGKVFLLCGLAGGAIMGAVWLAKQF